MSTTIPVAEVPSADTQAPQGGVASSGVQALWGDWHALGSARALKPCLSLDENSLVPGLQR
ncbi:MAG TPA: hypothetical protein VN880_01390 [Solirubrobacteraceae bacterium]|nr:hypothetical protein [Solirubrobacteraceae bacterium]